VRIELISELGSPSLLTMYLPKKPVAPNTVATIPLKEDLPPAPRFVSELTWRWGRMERSGSDHSAISWLDWTLTLCPNPSLYTRMMTLSNNRN